MLMAGRSEHAHAASATWAWHTGTVEAALLVLTSLIAIRPAAIFMFCQVTRG
jgi:hypothetical protein